MDDGDTAPYLDENYSILVELYCDGANFLIDSDKKEIEKVSTDFTQRRIRYAKEINNRRAVNESDT